MGKKSRIKREINYHIMALPGLAWLILFNIVPMFGVVMAFQDFIPSQGLLRSPWVGMENFHYLFSMNDFQRVIVNTLVISIAKLILNVVVPLTFALLLNEVTQIHFKRVVQTIVYLPHFLSWVILASIMLNVFGFKGIVNTITGLWGAEPVIWFSEESYFRQLVVGTDVWKEFGFNAVIYLAALTGINPNLYEAAAIDGCGKFKSVWHITLPSISSTIVLLTVLGLGNILNAGFDQVFNLYNPMVYSTGDIIDTFVYRMGLLNVQFSLATTVGLFKSAISFLLIILSYGMAYKFADYKVF